MTAVVLAVLTALLHLGVAAALVGPLAWWSARRRQEPVLSPGAGRALAAAAAIYVSSMVILRLPRVGPFADLQWNWQGKLALLIVLAVIVTAWSALTWRDVGLTAPRAGWWRPVVAVLVGATLLQLITGPMAPLEPTPETVAFQAIVPGLDEELLFRGILLVLLDRALGTPRARWGGHVGWAAPITTLLFGLAHGLHLEQGVSVAFDPAAIFFSGLVGYVLIWVRIRGGSLWPAILLHNGINSSVVLAAALTQ